MGLVVNDCTTKQRGSEYRSSDVDINLPTHDTDVTLFLPNGTPIVIQWRVEGPSLDICFDKDQSVINWTGENMEPAPADKRFKGGYVRMASQLCIQLPNGVLAKTETEDTKQERWCFTEEELKNPQDCRGDDSLIAYPINPDDPDRAHDGVVVQRNGTITNRWEDGTAGVPKSVKELAEAEETLCNPNRPAEMYDVWRDVVTDGEGGFVRFA